MSETSIFDQLKKWRNVMTTSDNSTLKLTLPSEREILVTRVFDAPQALIFEAWTTPNHVKRWFGCGSMTMIVCEIDLRVGGNWRYVLHDSTNNTDFGLAGKYHEIVPSERLVSTEQYDEISDSEHIVTLTLTEQEGKTTLQIHTLYPSVEHRDREIQAGMDTGLSKTLDRLEELLNQNAVSTSKQV
ncbi:SRPBCC family protein [Rivularia sp. UHCC 0363]|uniref:SRPBCC family protein n=1 Tax=Rivularia sp. UHCC 0363 TaxID=3110244 RepID=UPI002B219DB5|nr:SRPBCC family protein [Rivularia sp. UHCC 0363]MEA5598185.1 SRPBCC family protein [Rivularia sp. UHCC 0363]